MKQRLVIIGLLGLGLLALALLAIWWVDPDSTTTAAVSPSNTAGRHTTEQASEQLTDTEAPAVAKTGPWSKAARRLAVEPVESDPTAALAITLRGRCVDTKSQPIEGVTATLTASRNLATEATWRELPALDTGADGCFRFRFHVPERHRFVEFELRLRAAGYVVTTAFWFDFAPGSEIDLGDIPLRHGRKVAGRVVDTRGQPRQGVSIWFGEARKRRPEVLEPVRSYRASSAADGSFGFDTPVLAGHYVAKISQAVIASPYEFDIAQGPGTQSLKVVVVSELDLPTIRGVVVDGQGKPVRRAQVSVSPRIPRCWSPATRDDGTFTIAAGPETPKGPLQITIEHPDYEYFETPERHAWGAQGLRLVLNTATMLRLRVTDAATLLPIEDYKVWLSPAPGFRQPGINFARLVRYPGPHPGGEAQLTGLRRGTWLLKVLPTDPRWLESEFLTIAGGDAPRSLDVALVAPVVRTVQLAFADGRPAVGSLVELLQSPTEGNATIDLRSRAVPRGSWADPRRPYRWWSGRSDGRGQLQVRGPAGIGLTARVLGPGHLPTLRPGWVLAQQPDPIHVVVTSGATLFGKARPVDFLGRLRELGADTRLRGPGLRLVRNRRGGGGRRGGPGSGWHTTHPHDAYRMSPIGPAGSFALVGIPPGSWRLYLVWSRGSANSWTTHRHYLQDVHDLRDGDRRELELDLGHLGFATVSGRVYLDGEPTEGNVSLSAVGERRADGKIVRRGESMRAGSDGRFEASIFPGLYRAEINFGAISHPVDGTRSIRSGEKTSWDLHVRSRRVSFEVVDHLGQPCRGIRLRIGTGYPMHETAPSDASGRISARLPRNALKVWALPRSLRDHAARQAYRRQHKLSYWAVYTEVAKLAVASATDEARVRIQLPAAVTK